MARRGERSPAFIDTLPRRPSKKFGPYFIKDGWLMKEDPTGGDPAYISRYVMVKQSRRDIDTGKITLMLEYRYREETLTVECTRGMLTRTKVLGLLEVGVDVTDHNVKDVLMFLHQQEANAPLVNVHSSIGWGTHEDVQIFKTWQAIGCQSTYSGSLLLRPKGTLEDWIALVEEHVIGHTPMEFALTLGLSAPVNALIAQYTGLETILVHIHGDSSQGKSTATRVAVSTFGLPHTSTGGLIKHWNGTRNAILGHFRSNFGVPMALDEASMHESQSFSSLIYTLAAGSDKNRMTADGEMRSPAEWRGVILSNAEHSLQDKAGQNIGIRMRLLEIGNVRWTQSALHADALKEGLLRNYGHAGPAFVGYLLNIGEDEVRQRWKAWQQRCLELMPVEDRFSSRITDKLAVFLATAEMTREALNLDLDLDGMLQFLLKVNQDASQERDIGENARRHLVDIVTQHHRNFATSQGSESGYELWGKAEYMGGVLHTVNILPLRLKEILAQGGFQDPTVILQNWKAKGWLDHDANKLTRKKVIRDGNGRQSAYCIRVGGDLEAEPGSGSTPRVRKIAPGSVRTMHSDLFDE